MTKRSLVVFLALTLALAGCGDSTNPKPAVQPAVSAGVTHTCTLSRGGAAMCWGSNTYGELGNGTTTGSASPVPVAGGHTFSTIAAGGVFTCALEPNGAYCWGDNTFGELGNGTAASSSFPVSVSGGYQFNSIAAQWSGACALTRDSTAYCWGYNHEGQLGTGDSLVR